MCAEFLERGYFCSLSKFFNEEPKCQYCSAQAHDLQSSKIVPMLVSPRRNRTIGVLVFCPYNRATNRFLVLTISCWLLSWFRRILCHIGFALVLLIVITL